VQWQHVMAEMPSDKVRSAATPDDCLRQRRSAGQSGSDRRRRRARGKPSRHPLEVSASQRVVPGGRTSVPTVVAWWDAGVEVGGSRRCAQGEPIGSTRDAAPRVAQRRFSGERPRSAQAVAAYGPARPREPSARGARPEVPAAMQQFHRRAWSDQAAAPPGRAGGSPMPTPMRPRPSPAARRNRGRRQVLEREDRACGSWADSDPAVAERRSCVSSEGVLK
jgi:hypothetical protein